MEKVKLMDVYFQSVAGYTVEKKVINEKDYLIVPVVMIVEGVHHGSHGQILHLKEELEKSVSEWEGKPVTISHPKLNGVYVSATEEGVQDRVVGYVTNPYMDGDKLKAYVCLDEQKLIAVSPEVLTAINNQDDVEVSVGIFADDENISGEWKGEKYKIIARNHKPDHLALLPGEIGACSISDGCGLRVNKKGGKNVNEMIEVMKSQKVVFSPVVNEASFHEIMDQVWNLLSGKNSEKQYCYPEAVYEDYFIYQQTTYGDELSGSSSKMFKQKYVMSADDKVSLEGDPVEVKKSVSYITLNEYSGKRKRLNNNQKEEVKMCDKCPEKVDLLIQSSATNFTEDDRGWLEVMSEDKLDKMIPKRARTQPTEITVQEATKVIQTNAKGIDDYLTVLPEDVRMQVNKGLEVFKAQKDSLVQKILDNSAKDVWTKESLEVLPIDVLEKVEKSILKEIGNYAGRAGGSNPTPQVIAPMPIPGVEFKS